MTGQSGPRELVRYAAEAEDIGFIVKGSGFTWSGKNPYQ